MRRYYLGVDGGQSSTTALIADEAGRIVGRGQAGPCNHVAAPEAEEKFKRVIGGCVREACEDAKLDAETIVFTAACFGFSGGPHDKEIYTRALIRSEKYKFTHDAEIALTGAHEGAPGIVVIAGTGSMTFGRNAEGKTARAGGWGYVFGDEGGAFDLVRRALRAALAAEEGWGPDTLLTLYFCKQPALKLLTELCMAFTRHSGIVLASLNSHRY
jgi:N-acetylglucosamine kinase-like BadF-type ATPase